LKDWPAAGVPAATVASVIAAPAHFPPIPLIPPLPQPLKASKAQSYTIRLWLAVALGQQRGLGCAGN
jgi:hypothetical protein